MKSKGLTNHKFSARIWEFLVQKRRIFALGLIAIILVVVWPLSRFYTRHQAEPTTVGVSFSVKYARELGIEPRAAYSFLLEEVGARQLRLMSYWDELEPAKGSYSWEELDWQLSQAAAKGAKVSLALGMRQPRYPECHLPQWVNKSDPGADLKAYLMAVIGRYGSHPAISSWQLENEALNHTFGDCPELSRTLLRQELALVESLSDKPVIMSLSDQLGLPLSRVKPDVYGFSLYKRFWESQWLHRYLTYPWPAWWHTWRAALIEAYSGREVIIHELQAEPWGPKATANLSQSEQDATMNAAKLADIYRFARGTGIRTIYFWGGEWWYWRKAQGDSSLAETARAIFADPGGF